MGTPTEEIIEELFDVTVRMPKHAKLSDIERNALAAGIRTDRVEALINALRAVPEVKIGASVDAERAAKAKEQFTQAGLVVEVFRVMGLTALTTGRFDGLEECRACNHRVQFPANKECPNCGAFSDKVTDEMLLRQQLLKKERDALEFRNSRDQQNADKTMNAEREARIREEVRRELAAKMGLKPEKGGSKSKLVVAGLVALVVAFVAGRGLSGGWTMENLASVGKPPPTSQAKAGELLDKIDKGAPLGGSTSAAAAANGGPATGDPDIDDPLVQAAGGKQIGAKGISIEQAVASAQTLAKAGGYKGAGTEEASAAASGSPPAAPADGTPGASSVDAPAGAAPATASAAATSKAPALSPRTRALLALDLTRLVAQIGQVPRAQGMLKAVRAAPTTANDPEFVAAAKITEIEVRAWALHDAAPGTLRATVEALLKEAEALPDPFVRSKSLMEVAVIAARHPGLPPETARLFLTKSSEALPTIQGAQQMGAMSDWTVALGEVLAIEATARAKSGQWSRAKTLGTQVESLIAQAPDAAAQARLYAIDYQVKSLLGQHDKLAASLDAGLALVAKQTSVIDRATLLRSMARLSGAAMHEKMATAIEATKAAALNVNGFEHARALTLLALLHADAGMRARAGEYTQLAMATPKLSDVESAELTADLLLRGDMATARSLHRDGLFIEAESVLKRLGSFVL